MDEARPKAPYASGAWLAGPLSTGFGLAAHLAAGGPAPGLLILVALAALLGMAAAILGRFPLPGWALLLLCAVAQQLLHLGFSVFSGGSGTGLSLHGHGGISQDVPPAGGEVAAPAGHSLHLMLHLHMAAALAAYAAINYLPRLAAWARRISTGRQNSRAA
ncbi:hypothetical protein M1D93_02495 [Arthrobacter sp. Z1-9]